MTAVDSAALLALAGLGHSCPECGGSTFAQIDARQPDGSYAPGPERRCVNCKTTFSAEAFAALRSRASAL
jgi:hypothetical protein